METGGLALVFVDKPEKTELNPASKSVQISFQTSAWPFGLPNDNMPLGQGIGVNLFNLCFCPVPFASQRFSRTSSKQQYRCWRWWNIQDTTLFLLSTLISESHICVHTSERHKEIRRGKQAKNCSRANSSTAS